MTKVGIKYTRIFDGKAFLYKMTFTGKDDKKRAGKFADAYRRDDYKARVVKTPGGWSVYARSKKAWR